MLTAKEELRNWYNQLTEKKQLILWQKLSVYLNNSELKLCMSEVQKGKHDLFEIHYKHGFLQKYQIYLNQIMSNILEEGGHHGRDD